MGKKRDLANEHIVELIDKIIDYESTLIRNSCPKFDCPINDNKNKIPCEECKENYLEELREEMLKKYVVV